MGIPVGMGIALEFNGNGNNTPIWNCEWKWEGVGTIVYGNWNDTYSHGENSLGFFFIVIDLH